MYELADTTEQAALVAAQDRHVRVRVLLDRDYTGGRVNQAAYDYLSAHGVAVRWAPAGVIYHLKLLDVDDRTVDVSTANLTARFYADTWDATITDTNPVQVAAISATFAHDWAGESTAAGAVAAPGLLWSPAAGGRSAQAAVIATIASASVSVQATSEELTDQAVIDALAADARRHVTCQVVMTSSPEWAAGFAELTSAGCGVHVLPDRASVLYVHIKQILIDAGTPHAAVEIGSQNASVTSLTRNRELGLQLDHAQAPAVITALAAMFTRVYNEASTWQQ